MDANFLKMVKLHIPYPEPIEGIWGESVWATPLKYATYRLENDPLIEGLYCRDIVKAYYDDGLLTFESFVMRDSSVEDNIPLQGIPN